MKAQKPAGFVSHNESQLDESATKSPSNMRSLTARIVLGLIAGNFAFTTAAQAQMWGTGQWGGMQGCNQPGYGAAAGATSESDEVQELRRTENDLKQEKKEVAKDIRELERERERLAQSINEGLVPNWASIFISHMDANRNCCINPPEGADVPRREPAPPQDDGAYDPPPEPELPAPRPRAPKPKPAPPKKMSSNDEDFADRAPAAAGTGIPQSQWGPDLGENVGGGGFGGGGASQTMCYPASEPYTLNKFLGFACQADGGINPAVCSAPGLFQRGGVKSAEANACSRAIARYRKVARELDKLEARKAQIADELADLKVQLRESIRDARSEAVCTTCGPGGRGGGGPGPGRGGGGGTNWGSVLTSLAPILAGAAIGGGLEYLNYSQNKSNNQNLNKLGWPTQPYQFGNYMYPFATAGIYGSALAGVNGGFGCAAGVGGGGYPYGPMGMGGPFGMSPYSNMGGPFGYPNGMMPGFPQMGGGMYGQGFGPWGMAGPWGNGMMNPALMGGMGGMPGMGIGMGFGAGIGMPGLGMGMPGMGFGGMPGMGMGMGMPGMGMGMGMPGMGLGAGFGLGMPGMGLAGMGGMPGLGLGIGMPGMGMPGLGMPGMGSPFGGMPGIGGVGGMYNPMSPFGGQPFGQSPYGMSPYGMGQQNMMNPYMDQQRQYYNNQIGRQVQGQQLYQKYYSVMSELQAFNSGMSLMNSGIGGYGGYGGGLGIGVGLGISGGLNYGTSLGGAQTPWITGGPGGIAPFSATPGRSR